MSKKLSKTPEVFIDHRVARIWVPEDAKILVDLKILDSKIQGIIKELKMDVVKKLVDDGDQLRLTFYLGNGIVSVATWPDDRFILIDLISFTKNKQLAILKSIIKGQIKARGFSVGKISYS